MYEPEVVSIGGGRGWFEIAWRYIGGIVSIHGAYIRGRHLRREAREWRDGLALHIRAYLQEREDQPEAPLTIGIFGYFKDGRSRPDFDNLHKLIGDAVQAATGINDKHFLWHDQGWLPCEVADRETGEQLILKEEPTLLIRVWWRVEQDERYKEYLERGQHGPDI